MTREMYAVGDRVKDLTFDPPMTAVVIGACENKPDKYDIRLDTTRPDGTAIRATVHARNLERISQ